MQFILDITKQDINGNLVDQVAVLVMKDGKPTNSLSWSHSSAGRLARIMGARLVRDDTMWGGYYVKQSDDETVETTIVVRARQE